MQYLLDKINALAAWFLQAGLYLFEQAVSLVMTALGALLTAIPVPAWMQNAGNVIANVPPSMAFLVHAFLIPEGIAIMVSAYTIRFVIRRIPVIG